MKHLIDIARHKVDQAEVYHTEDSSDSISFSDGKLDKADSTLSSGIALRIIKDGKVGLAHTRNLLDADTLLRQAMISAENGMEAGFRFPLTTDVFQPDTYSPSVETLSKKDLIDEGKRIIDYINARCDSQVNIGIGYGIGQSGLINSAGTALDQKGSGYGSSVQMIFPGTGSGLFHFVTDKQYRALDFEMIDEMIELFAISKNEIVPPTSVMPVIFMPMCMYALIWRLHSAINPANIHTAISPLCNRLGEKIISDKITLRQDPHADDMDNSCGFDSEGTPTRPYAYFDKGVFTTIPTDLNYAEKLKLEPTGNGVRDSVEGMPQSSIINPCLEPGIQSLQDMIASIDQGIIVHSVMGAHSGNILNGDFSVGVSAGFMIEKGVLTGRVKDCMLSGNVYDIFNRDLVIENKATNLGSRKSPAVLFDGISVAGK